MKIAVVGTGYVGLVAGACLAETGNDVRCADLDEEKISRLKGNDIPIYEPGLKTLVVRNQTAGRLVFTTDVGAAVRAAEVVFIAVGTPPGEDGSADLKHVLAVARTIGENMNSTKVVITKSTVPVGTAELVRAAIKEKTEVEFFVCSNPEFLKEGAAVEDFMRPDRVVVGVDSQEAQDVLTALYEPFLRTGNPIMFMDIPSAEVTKYAANAMLATRISFMNEIAELCERVGANVSFVRKGMGSDSRIGKSFLFPGPGYGGSCFPKDVQALIKTARDHGVEMRVLDSVEETNALQKKKLFGKVSRALGETLSTATVALWGMAFKAETDDMRESPAIDLIEALLEAGVTVKAHDPEATEPARVLFGDRVTYCDNPYDAVDGADAMVIVTEWQEFRNPDFSKIKALMKRPLVIDGRNLYKPSRMRDHGFEYVSFGRPT
jgi:UDPglucose 6-dehydrogenase